MYLSCLEIDTSQESGRRWLANDYCVHQRLRKAFPDRTPDVLYRVEALRQPPRILVQAPCAADWDECFSDLPVVNSSDQKQLCVSSDGASPLEGASLADRRLTVWAGREYRFLLRANPTARRGPERPREGKSPQKTRVGLLREEEQRDWLERKGEAHGFKALVYEVRPLGSLTFTRPKDGKRLSFLGVEFEGRLQVTDPELFAAALEQGIGSGKGFGFGLLSLAPAR